MIWVTAPVRKLSKRASANEARLGNGGRRKDSIP